MPLYCVARADDGIKSCKIIRADNPIEALELSFPDAKPGQTFVHWNLSSSHMEATITGEKGKRFPINVTFINIGEG